MKHLDNTILTGVPVSPGLASGSAFIFQDIFERQIKSCPIEAGQLSAELDRMEKAFADVSSQLKLAIKRVSGTLGPTVAEIFQAHQMILEDEELKKEIRGVIKEEQVCAERALQKVFHRWEEVFRLSETTVFRQRGDDIADLGRRLLRCLAGVEAHSLENMPKGAVVVARRLLPSETVFLSLRSAVGVIVQTGGKTSHCAVLTRAIGIPAIVLNRDDLFDLIHAGDELLLDGLRGKITICPNESTRKAFEESSANYFSELEKAQRRASLPSRTEDGTDVPVLANVGGLYDAERALANGAEGIGLFRIEAFYLGKNKMPTEAELSKELRSVVELFRDKPVCIRLLDIGGDKALPYLPLAREENPNLGQRGIRLLLAYPEVLRRQLKVLLKISADQEIMILVPMVTLAGEMDQLREILSGMAAEMGIPRLPKLGAMIETPAAACYPEPIIERADFLSVGTNDLTQFMMAADRENPLVGKYYQETHPSILNAIGNLCEKAGGKLVAVCGELASDSSVTSSLIQSGVRLLSVAPPIVPLVKESVRRTSVGPS